MPQEEIKTAKPTIKGIFVNSHIKALLDIKGQNAIVELERRFGKRINFANSEDVLISDEVKIIEICLDLVSPSPIPIKDKDFEAGRLHFKNFVTTPLAKIIFSMFKNSFKLMMLNSDKIAGHVFQGVKFSTTVITPTQVKITMENNDYPLNHFKGLFYEWMTYSELKGQIDAQEVSDNVYTYTITWK